MNGYLMQEQSWTPGEDCFFESFSPENRYGVVFEDDGESAYFYAVEKDEEGTGVRILDALHIHESEEEYLDEDEPLKEGEASEEEDQVGPDDRARRDDRAGHENPSEEQHDPEHDEQAAEDGPSEGWNDPADLKIIWSRDWLKCALVLDGYVHALFDFENQGGYNMNEFPPPNSTWTQHERKLTPELIQRFF